MPLLMTVVAQAYQVSPPLFLPGIPNIQRHLRMSLHMFHMVHSCCSSMDSTVLAILALIAIHMQHSLSDFQPWVPYVESVHVIVRYALLDVCYLFLSQSIIPFL